MARPREPLTGRELEVMRVFWDGGGMTSAEVRDRLSDGGRDLNPATVTNLCRGLVEKRFLKRTGSRRPITYAPRRGFDAVAREVFGSLIRNWFGNRHGLLVHLLGDGKLSKAEREYLRGILEEAERSKGAERSEGAGR